MGKRSDGSAFGRTFLIFLLAVSIGFSLVFPGRGAAVETGTKVKAFVGETLSGEKVEVDFAQGAPPVILTFWSIYCRSCTEELEKIQALVEKYGSERVRVYAVNEDTEVLKKRVGKFLTAFEEKLGKLSFTVLYDQGEKLLKKFSVLHLPTLLYVDGDGTVREVIEGFEPGRQRAVISALSLLLEEVSPEVLRKVEEEKYYEVHVRVPVCGVYRDGTWVRPLDDTREGREGSLKRSMDLADSLALREVVVRALKDVGIELLSTEKDLSCLKPYGMDHRLVAGEEDAYDAFIRDWDLRDAIKREEETRLDRGKFVEGFYTFRVNLQVLQELIVDAGYSLKPVTYVLKYVNPSLYSHLAFVSRIPGDVPLVSGVKRVERNGQVVEDELVCYVPSPDVLMEKLEKINLERERVTAEYLGGNVVEIQFWR
ncbi:MAG: TlpA family protein disulfide reductase [Deltaproteobacteria bacterium]|nr:MAG: TlpA family protein disulfide reductase [Deltaproteobacteria bacterium]